jgi:hypothetical protein
MQVVPFDSQHIFGLNLQDAQREFYDKFTPEYGYALAQAGGGYTALVDGHPVCCAGLIEQWHGRALAWALVGDDSGRYFPRIVKAMRRMLDLADYRRIEAQVDCKFIQGIRLARLLGFELESKMEAFTPDGRDSFMYVRIKR